MPIAESRCLCTSRSRSFLLDFVGAKSFCADAIDELILFNQKLRTKGSRMALCCLDPTVHQSFFGKNNGHEQRK